jgi:hypothetical protein
MAADQTSADIHLAHYLAAQDQQRYDSALSAQTSFTWVQKTIGIGFRVMGVHFDVMFTAEPTFAPGAAILSISAADYMPYTQAILMYWNRDPKNGLYIGASVALAVELRHTPGFVLKNHSSSGSDVPVPTVAHHLTFNGPSVPAPPGNTGGPKKTGMTP